MSDHHAQRVRLTIAIAAHEFSAEFEKTLSSAASLADELIIVSLGSSSFPGKLPVAGTVIHRAHGDDPAAARNQVMDAAQGDWVLWLEAGETLAPQTVASIRHWLHTDAALARATAFLVWVETATGNAELHPEVVAAPRLLPTGAGLSFQGRVRETVLPALEKAAITLQLTDWHIHAANRNADLATAIERTKQEIRLAGLEMATLGMSARVLCASAEAHSALGDYVKATQHFYQALRLADRGSVEMLVAYYGLLATFRGDESDHRQRLAVCLEALETYPLDAQLLLAMGTFLQQQNHLELASRSFRAATEIGEVEPCAPHLKDVRAIAAVSWSLMLQLRGENEQALEVLRMAGEKFPHAENLTRRRLELLVQLGRDVEALSLASAVAPHGVGPEPFRIGLRGACLAAQGNWIPALTYLRTAYEADCRDPICLRWYAVGMLALGQHDSARPILREWKSVAPHDAEVERYLTEFDVPGAAKTASRDTKKRTVRVDVPVSLGEHHDALQHASGVPAPQG